MFFHSFIKYFIPFVAFIVLVPTLFIPAFTVPTNLETNLQDGIQKFDISHSSFKWPIPGYTRISSYFGRRNSPTKGASSYHQGIDIPAPAGTSLIAPCNSQVIATGFKGSGGYTISLKFNKLEFVYHHVSPKYIVKIGDYVLAGQIIGQVGPKNVYGVKNNPYKDSSGKPTNGATTGSHLHFSIKKDGKAVNPLDYFS